MYPVFRSTWVATSGRVRWAWEKSTIARMGGGQLNGACARRGRRQRRVEVYLRVAVDDLKLPQLLCAGPGSRPLKRPEYSSMSLVHGPSSVPSTRPCCSQMCTAVRSGCERFRVPERNSGVSLLINKFPLFTSQAFLALPNSDVVFVHAGSSRRRRSPVT